MGLHNYNIILVVFFFCLPAIAEIKARNLPAEDKVLFVMGQSSDSLTEYKREVLDVDSTMPKPGGFTLYTYLSLQPNHVYSETDFGRPLSSIFGSGEWGDGEHNLKKTLSEYPNAAIVIGLNLSDNTFDNSATSCLSQPLRAIAGYKDDDVKEMVEKYHYYIDRLLVVLKKTKRPVFLRIGYEFDGMWNCYQPEPYKKAFRYFKSRIDALEAHNIATVWQSAAFVFETENPIYLTSRDQHFEQWYPGDDVVDWVSFSTFLAKNFTQFQVPVTDDVVISPDKLRNKILDFARERNKPVMLAESSPQGFDLKNNLASNIAFKQKIKITDEKIWDNWFADWFGLIEQNKDVIRAAAYINNHWDRYSMWRCDEGAQKKVGEIVPADPKNPDKPACPTGVAWGDSRIQVNDYIYKRFKQELNKEHFINSNPQVLRTFHQSFHAE